jgi:NADPH-dependent 2,4-dienoyl-CoA reductase/sulfur reductase-like enzyme
MNRREFLAAPVLAVAPLMGASSAACDVFVYGSTPGGIAAAIEAARQGLKVILACPKKHLGGMAASGLSTTDAVRTEIFGGLVAEFISRVREHYARLLEHQPEEFKLTRDGWFYEPSVAELVFDQMVQGEEKLLRWLPGSDLIGATVKGAGSYPPR